MEHKEVFLEVRDDFFAVIQEVGGDGDLDFWKFFINSRNKHHVFVRFQNEFNEVDFL